jgi:hypothetical protein
MAVASGGARGVEDGGKGEALRGGAPQVGLLLRQGRTPGVAGRDRHSWRCQLIAWLPNQVTREGRNISDLWFREQGLAAEELEVVKGSDVLWCI